MVFTEGRLHNFDAEVLGDWWLYEQVHPAKDGRGELQVMLQNTDLIISARAVSIWGGNPEGWVVGDDPHMVAPYE